MRQRKALLLALSFVLQWVSVAFIDAQEPAKKAVEHTKDALDDVKAALASKKAVLVDVREKKEWDAGHLQDATSLPLSLLKKGVDAAELAKTLPKDKVIYCHCAAGVRSLQAADILQKQGFDVRPLQPGYNDLVTAGFPPAKK